MRKSLTKFSRFLNAERCAFHGFSIGFQRCKSPKVQESQGAKVQKCVHLVDLVKSFQTSIYLQKIRRYSRERASQSLPKISQKLEKILRINVGTRGTLLH